MAIISNSFTPYRENLHRRLVKEVPEIRWYLIFTHEQSTFPWPAGEEATQAQVKVFGPGERCPTDVTIRESLHEWRKGGRILQYLAAETIDAVVVGGYSDLGRVRIILECRRRGLPVLLFGDSNIRADTLRGVRRRIKRASLPVLLRRCSGVLVCGSLGELYYRRYGVAGKKIFRFPYEPDYALLAESSGPSPDSLPTVRRRKIVYSGRLVAKKRVDLLIRAYADIADRRPDWDLVIIGDGPMRGSLGRLVPDHLRGRVSWAGFVEDERSLAALYRSADVLVLPSDVEPWGIVVTEAAAAGLALVTSDVVGAGEDLVVEGVNGCRFPAGDLSALTAALRTVTDGDAIDRYRAGSREVFHRWHESADPIRGIRAALGLN
ncbi:glycosyltransferase family 4 protein [Frankia tisae]|uniref:glycosyltransferase family 4 protein n=1 Tax=Frankia tisae TaxID=2950104 RepID=UPI0021BEE2F6|nr:glycosyltransferase family 4 protein [Frankia tisae]